VSLSGERVGDVVLVADPGGPGVSPGTAAVLRATIDRPEARNAISPSVVEGLEAAVRRAGQIGARVLVVRGAAGTFCAGADLEFVRSTIDQPGALDDGGAFASVIRRLNDILLAIEAAPFASVAVVEGFALAGGCELLLACDVVVADEEARIGDRHLDNLRPRPHLAHATRDRSRGLGRGQGSFESIGGDDNLH